MDCKYKVDLPYPSINIKQKSRYEVNLLMSAYGGKGSETTAIMGYIYQSYVLAPDFPDIASCLEKIAITEMHHHDLLGSTIVALGGTPYIGGNNGYWQGGYVNYSKSPLAILNNDIAGEKEAINLYKEIIRFSKMPEIKELLERIIMDEELHVVTLETLRQNYFNK